jgi:hypothetical protein
MLSHRGRFADPETDEVGELAINLEEWLYLRRAARVWKDCVANTNYIQKVEMSGCAAEIMIPRGKVTDSEMHQIFETAMSVTEDE